MLVLRCDVMPLHQHDPNARLLKAHQVQSRNVTPL
jgi:hypothetical protein